MRSVPVSIVLAALVLAFAPLCAAAQTVDALPMRAGGPSPGYFGALIVDAPDTAGAVLRDVLPQSPAETAGLRPGDLITHVADTPIAGARELIEALQSHGAGGQVLLVVRQSGFRNTVAVTLGDRPLPERRRFADFGRVPMARQPSNRPFVRIDTLLEDRTPPDERLGLRTVAATRAALQRRGLPDRPGALVMRVGRDSPADLAGIPISSLIVSANGQAITSPQSLAVALAASAGDAELTYCIGDEERTCRVEAGR